VGVKSGGVEGEGWVKGGGVTGEGRLSEEGRVAGALEQR
jgi:hypothetical protein